MGKIVLKTCGFKIVKTCVSAGGNYVSTTGKNNCYIECFAFSLVGKTVFTEKICVFTSCVSTIGENSFTGKVIFFH